MHTAYCILGSHVSLSRAEPFLKHQQYSMRQSYFSYLLAVGRVHIAHLAFSQLHYFVHCNCLLVVYCQALVGLEGLVYIVGVQPILRKYNYPTTYPSCILHNILLISHSNLVVANAVSRCFCVKPLLMFESYKRFASSLVLFKIN